MLRSLPSIPRVNIRCLHRRSIGQRLFHDKIGKVVCIGRNYTDHIKELGNERPSDPVFFLKPSSSIVANRGQCLIPKNVDAHHEVELALVIGREIRNFSSTSEKDAIDSISGYALAVDMTARNIQSKLKAKGLPWALSKGFDTFLPLSSFIDKSEIPNPYDAELELRVNGQIRQKDKANLMIHRIPKILSYISSVMTLKENDILLTGTPKGCGPLLPGELMECRITVHNRPISNSILSIRAVKTQHDFIATI